MTTARRVDIRVEVDVWDWKSGTKADTVTLTKLIQSYRFQKSIKSPKGSCQVTLMPQAGSAHMLDVLSPMDVIRIYEFGTLKFIGYLVRISYSGSIGQDGRPSRNVVLTVSQYGGLFVDASTGMGIGIAIGRPEQELYTQTASLKKAISDAAIDGISYKELIEVVINEFETYLQNLGADNFLNYVREYFEIGAGLAESTQPALPRTFELFSGREQSLTLWQVIEQLIERPFNEIFIDNGPRPIYLDGKTVDYSNESSTIIARSTPFDGTVGGVSSSLFASMDTVSVDNDHLVRFDLSRSMEEAYTTYAVKHEALHVSEIARMMLGEYKIDAERLGKYLFKPLITELFYVRAEKIDETGEAVPNADLEDVTLNSADTLKEWFKRNDEYLSGAITIMVPEDSEKDPKIGTKAEVYGIEGDFYVEAIAHTWQYQGPLKSNLTVTRGYNRTENKKIELKDRIFYRNRLE